ncbi:sigma-70 family RNA polymerase sigma factor [Angustibacter peucedani]
MEDDHQLALALSRGDPSALERCYARFGPVVLAYLRRLVGPDDAEDVLQRTFLDVWRAADRFDASGSLSGWLFTIARRRAIDDLRRRRPAVVAVETIRDLVGDDGEQLADRFAWAADVRSALQRLPDAQRVTLELAYFEDCTQAEIARRMDVPLGTVKARMARGSRALAQLLDGYDGHHDRRAPGHVDDETTEGGGG